MSIESESNILFTYIMHYVKLNDVRRLTDNTWSLSLLMVWSCCQKLNIKLTWNQLKSNKILYVHFVLAVTVSLNLPLPRTLSANTENWYTVSGSRLLTTALVRLRFTDLVLHAWSPWSTRLNLYSTMQKFENFAEHACKIMMNKRDQLTIRYVFVSLKFLTTSNL